MSFAESRELPGAMPLPMTKSAEPSLRRLVVRWQGAGGIAGLRLARHALRLRDDAVDLPVDAAAKEDLDDAVDDCLKRVHGRASPGHKPSVA